MRIGIDGIQVRDLERFAEIVKGEKFIEREPSGRVILVTEVKK